MVFHGNGGYDWNTIYDMPIWLRNFTFGRIKDYYDKQQEAQEKQNNMMTNKSKKQEISKPNIAPKPDYVAKAKR
jgi:hypothetical protein